jgi:hypothetical protein
MLPLAVFEVEIRAAAKNIPKKGCGTRKERCGRKSQALGIANF